MQNNFVSLLLSPVSARSMILKFVGNQNKTGKPIPTNKNQHKKYKSLCSSYDRSAARKLSHLFHYCGEARAIQLRLRARLFGHLWTFIGILPDAYGDDTILSHFGWWVGAKNFSNKRDDSCRRNDHRLCIMTEITMDMLMPFNALSLAGI